jgi:hypothetical protein
MKFFENSLKKIGENSFFLWWILKTEEEEERLLNYH